ncbi:MAG: hypothetical protein V3U74_05630 [Thermodesulfobacteriota bacterium]
MPHKTPGGEIDINEQAVSQQGKPLDGYIAVYGRETMGPSHGKFLDEYRRLAAAQQKKNWR